MVVDCGVICARRGFGNRFSAGQTFLNLLNCRSLLFARSAAGGFGFVQGMMQREVSWNPRRLVVVTRAIS